MAQVRLTLFARSLPKGKVSLLMDEADMLWKADYGVPNGMAKIENKKTGEVYIAIGPDVAVHVEKIDRGMRLR